MSLCDPKAPPDLQTALRNIPDLQRYVKERSMSELRDALDAIYMHQPVLRQIVYDEITVRERAEANARSQKSLEQTERHHVERQWWTRFSVAVAAASFLIALASFLVGRYLPTPQVSALEARLTAIEHQLAMTPQPTTPLPSPKPQQTQSESTSPPAPSNPPISGSRK